MKFTAAQIANFIDGEIIGDPNTIITDFGNIETAGKNALTFFADKKFEPFLRQSEAAIVIFSEKLNPPTPNNQTYIKVKDAYASMTALLNVYQNLKPVKSGIEEPTFIDSSAELGENIYVGAFAYIGKNVKIAKDVKIYPHAYIGDDVKIESGTIIYSGVKIYHDCIVGKNCIIHAGSIIGSDGFGFLPDAQGVFHKVPQVGNVIIKDNVEIGAACTIDRATMGSTLIEKGVKLDNQIQLAHNVIVGENTVIASQTGVAGSSKIGKNNMIGGQVGIAGHLSTGDFVQIQAQSGINHHVKSNQQLYGSPAFDAMDFRKSYVYFRKLPELMQKLDKIERQLKKES